MTQEEKEYLEDLHVLEGNFDKSGINTSEFYGITDAGINMVSNTIRRKDADGNYTENAMQTRSKLSPQLLKVLEDNIVWDSKQGKMIKWASLSQINKFGQEGFGQMALAIRDINKRKMPIRESEPLTSRMENCILLTAHNRPTVLKKESFLDVLRSGNVSQIRHKFLNDLDGVDPKFYDGIRKRQAACFNLNAEEVSPREAWLQLDFQMHNGNPNAVNDVYKNENIDYEDRKKQESVKQAIDSKYKGSMEVVNPMPDKQINEQKQPENKSFLQRLGEIGMAIANPMYDVVRKAQANQVANDEANMLNNENGVQQ